MPPPPARRMRQFWSACLEVSQCYVGGQERPEVEEMPNTLGGCLYPCGGGSRCWDCRACASGGSGCWGWLGVVGGCTAGGWRLSQVCAGGCWRLLPVAPHYRTGSGKSQAHRDPRASTVARRLGGGSSTRSPPSVGTGAGGGGLVRTQLGMAQFGAVKIWYKISNTTAKCGTTLLCHISPYQISPLPKFSLLRYVTSCVLRLVPHSTCRSVSA